MDPISTQKMLAKKRQLSDISGKSQTGSDTSGDESGSNSRSNSSSQFGCNRRKTTCKFDDFKNMHNRRKCIFTRKVHNRNKLILNNKIPISQQDMPQIASSLSQIDLDQLSRHDQQIQELKQFASPSHIKADKQFYIV